MSRNSFFFLSLLFLAGCGWDGVDLDSTFTVETEERGSNAPDFGGDDTPSDELDRDDAKAVWGSRDDPSLFANDLEYRIAELPQSKTLDVSPWAANYWPVYQDSINYRWNGSSSQSPAAKYGEAFGVDNVEDRVSSTHGVDKYSSRTACTETSQCDSAKGESCAKRTGEDAGYCIPTWWGICHAWAPAAILEREPEHPVTRNGVEFKVNDIKALTTLAYNGTDVRFVSLRCDEDADDIEYDGYDRPTGDDAECADTNPGTYHVLLTNYLGLRGESFVEDRTFDDEVWNQPLRGYRITRMNQVTPQEANELVGVEEEPTTVPSEVVGEFNGSVAAGGWHHEGEISVAGADKFKVTMTGTSDADLYVRFGSQPTESNYDCRPWLNGSAEQCSLDVPAGATRAYVSVQGYSGTSTFEATTTVLTGGSETTSGYRFNPEDGLALYDVALQVDYITESPAHTDGNLSANIDSYTRTDHYTYVLEVDSDGKVVGGEWTGSSKRNHPDFLWLPTSRTEGQSLAGGAIQWHLVKELLDASVSPVDGGDDGGDDLTVETVDNNGTIAKNEWAHFGPFDASAGTITAEMTGTADADLYLRMGSQPTTSAYDCRPYRNGSVESCTAEGPGQVYVSVRGYAASSNYALTVSFYVGAGDTTDPTPEPDPDPEQETEHLNEAGNVAQGEMTHFAVEVTAGQKIVVRTVAPNDLDLYVKFGSAPTTSSYDQRGYTASGNETIEVTPSASGTLHVAVHGYAASSYTLTTADN